MIREITADEFNKFTLTFNLYSVYQTPEYGFVMNNQNFSPIFLGLEENGNILGATLVLIEKKKGFKYAYAPRGFLIDYTNYNLLETFTKEIKKYLGKQGITAIKISPLIIKNTYDIRYNIINNNPYYDKIFDNLKKLDYYHFGYNNYFEGLKPRFEAIIDLDIPYYMLFNNIRKEYKTKIRSAEGNGIKVYKGTNKNLDLLYTQTLKKYPRDLEYFKDCYKYFKKENKVEFFFTKLDTNKYLKVITKKYHDQERLCNYYNHSLNKLNGEKIVSLKMEADKLLDKYKRELIKATNYLRDYPDGIITSSALIIKNKDEIFLLMDGYDLKYKSLNSKHLLIWKLIERYSKLGFKKFNLGGTSNPNLENNKYQGLNDFKFGFDSKCVEYIGDLELVTNNALYFMYKNSIGIKNILKK
jgi:lipid II:glycine glycyltransferase (peptidoglycan interpeptide bridge formation enzyme)